MIENNKQQIDDEKDKPNDELVINEMRKISDSYAKTEAYYHTKHLEIETKYGMLGGKD